MQLRARDTQSAYRWCPVILYSLAEGEGEGLVWPSQPLLVDAVITAFWGQRSCFTVCSDGIHLLECKFSRTYDSYKHTFSSD